MTGEDGLLLWEAPLPVYRFGALVALGALLSLALLLRQKGRAFSTRDTLLEALCFLSLMPLGARVCYCLVRLSLLMEWKDYGFFFRFSDGGYMIHGALMAAPLAAAVCSRLTGKRAVIVMDDLSPSFALTFAAAYLGEHWIGQGRSMAEVSGLLRFFPLAVYSPEMEDWLYAVALWECLFCLALYAVLRLVKWRKAGEKTQFFYLALCGGLIFFSDVENDAALSWGFVRSPQVFSLGILLLVLIWRGVGAHADRLRLFFRFSGLLLLALCLLFLEVMLDRVQAEALLWYTGMAVVLVLLACLIWRAGNERKSF